ncbi:PorP/SprF family type IX secretion system membrane protein [Cesiribacter andamanensis]|uniref:Uncharacterized protein n=1 Tax=Cesiribacter andamanensis AMV16 TaxID=1279009 RepID=M7NSN3_9BACT|nr:hypothetical protein [Cesiribacter andamanensis]EMR04700.1 hypothetical protein ADICEAN_00152 [Cesiribacter andamanensis AMV16]
MQFWKVTLIGGLLLLLAPVPSFGQRLPQQRYTHFPWTYDRTVSAGIGAEGTAFTFLGRSRPDTLSGYAALAIPLPPIRGAIGGYYHQQLGTTQQLSEWGLGYTLFLPFTEETNLRLGVQQNWHSLRHTGQPEGGTPKPDQQLTSTDFSGLLRRDNLLLGLSMENALNKGQRQYNALLGFRELQSYSWLRSSSFLLVQIQDGRELPEFRFNYTGTVLNTLLLGGSYYKNGLYQWGANAGFKFFRSLWLVAGADFKGFTTQPDALELGLRLNVGRGRIRPAADEDRRSSRLWEEGP